MADLFHKCWTVAQQTGWKAFTFDAVVRAYPEVSLEALYACFSAKEDLIPAFIEYINAQVHLDRTAGDTLKDVLFEMILQRLEALAAYKTLLRDILESFWGFPYAVARTACALHKGFYRHLTQILGWPEGRIATWVGLEIIMVLYGRLFYFWLSHEEAAVMVKLDQLLTEWVPTLELLEGPLTRS